MSEATPDGIDEMIEATTPDPVKMPRMVGDRLLIRRDTSRMEALLKEGPDGKKIELLDETKEADRPLEGEVLAISTAIEFHNPRIRVEMVDGKEVEWIENAHKTAINVGDHIKYAAYASNTTILLGDEELVVLTIDDVLCVD